MSTTPSAPTPPPEPTPEQPATYTVVAGDNPGSIAERFNVSTADLLEANNIANPSSLQLGQVLVIPQPGVSTPSQPTVAAVPAPTTPTPRPEPAPGQPVTYAVVAGDNPGSIAERFKVSTADLLAANEITNPSSLQLGQVLVIPVTPTPVAATTSAVAAADRPTYTVASGDTASEIAATFSTTVRELAALNGTTEAGLRNLQIGQQIVVPGAPSVAAVAPGAPTVAAETPATSAAPIEETFVAKAADPVPGTPIAEGPLPALSIGSALLAPVIAVTAALSPLGLAAVFSCLVLLVIALALALVLVRHRRARRAPADVALTSERVAAAVRLSEFGVHFQPVFDRTSGQVVGAEALVRWEQPGMEAKTARQFFGRAASAGILDVVMTAALGPACEFARECVAATSGRFMLHVNLSQSQLGAGKATVEAIRGALEASEFKPRSLQVEATEQALLEAGPDGMTTLRALADLGVNIAVDDFWGQDEPYWALAIPGVNAVKIDLRSNTANESTREQLANAARIAHGRKLTVTAKRVESSFEVEFAAEVGCDQVQGHAYGKPMSATAFRAFLASGGHAAVDESEQVDEARAS
ncbi:MAG: LysM peptidoglycan-binding domain-containing protein [Dehalococcoidia bacterium]